MGHHKMFHYAAYLKAVVEDLERMRRAESKVRKLVS